MCEVGCNLFVRRGQRHPGLDSEQLASGGANLWRRAFGMNDAGTCRHPVDLAGTNGLHIAEIVPVGELAVDQVSNRRKADMGMRAYVETTACIENRRTHMVEEDKRPDHAPSFERQGAPHLEAVGNVTHGWQNDGLHSREVGLEKGHGSLSSCMPRRPVRTRPNGTLRKAEWMALTNARLECA